MLWDGAATKVFSNIYKQTNYWIIIVLLITMIEVLSKSNDTHQSALDTMR